MADSNHLKSLCCRIHYQEDDLELSLSPPSPTPPPRPSNVPSDLLFFPPLQPQPQPQPQHMDPRQDQNPRQKRHRRNGPRSGDETIPPPFAWATNRRATVHPLSYLLANAIQTISGKVQCKRCGARRDVQYDLQSKFTEIGSFIVKNMESLNQRAPRQWMNPKLPDCRDCNQKECMEPVISNKKRSINWLFLLLGNLLGCCTLRQLKYFCKHTKQHRTGAKDRVLFEVYVVLCKQLDPEGPFLVRNH